MRQKRQFRTRVKREEFTTRLMVNCKSGDETHVLRRKVIEKIHQAKELIPSMPRVTIRIAEPSEHSVRIHGVGPLGVGRSGDRVIWISPEACNRTSLELRHVVFHEIGHAVFGKSHTKSGLMAPVVNTTTKFQQDAELKAMAS